MKKLLYCLCFALGLYSITWIPACHSVNRKDTSLVNDIRYEKRLFLFNIPVNGKVKNPLPGGCYEEYDYRNGLKKGSNKYYVGGQLYSHCVCVKYPVNENNIQSIEIIEVTYHCEDPDVIGKKWIEVTTYSKMDRYEILKDENLKAIMRDKCDWKFENIISLYVYLYPKSEKFNDEPYITYNRLPQKGEAEWNNIALWGF